jgi:uncharacterized protein involved in exopolysaccharide biosynthesis
MLDAVARGRALPESEVARDEYEEAPRQNLTITRLRPIWENRRFLTRLTLGAMVVFSIIALLIPNRYQSTARLMPPESEGGSGLALAAAALAGGSGGLGGMAGELLGQKSTSDLIVGVLRSRTVEDKLIQQFDFKKTYGNRPIEDLRKILENRTEISIDHKSQIITVVVSDRSPQVAAAMTGAYVEELNRTLASVSTSSARRERIFLEDRLAKVSKDLEASEQAFSQFASKSGAIDIKEQGKAMVTAAATLEGELIAARSELEGLRQIYSDNNIRVRAAQARISELQSELAKVGGQDDETSPDSADATTSPDAMYPSIRKLPLLGVPYADLYRKTRVQEALFETLTQKYELAKVQEAKEIPTIKVLDPPSLPERKSFPPRTLIVLFGAAFAFSCGIIWMFARRRWEETDASDPAKVLALEVFETVRAAIPWGARNGYSTSSKTHTAGESSQRDGTLKES